eukprot:TRINITY_DN11348_c0_g1_i1.p1 TRINITY_DN11348_c0_g1~~TRINITY_DN11348_c0_g1_i1.p1  ORF type:complete len:233 (-),score=22.76 TRINITY_DN11348_c0_g1_i1:236-934(-)
MQGVRNENDNGSHNQLELNQLPCEVVVRLVEVLSVVGKPGAVLNFMLVNKKTYQVVQSLDDLWREQCHKQGWYHDEAQQHQWFQHYCQRQQARWSVRKLLKQYIHYMDIKSQSALQRGASAGQIAFHEQRLQAKLPWELWELYRHRNGQEYQLQAVFVDELRLLQLHEVVCESRQIVVDGQFQDILIIKFTDNGRGGRFYGAALDGKIYICTGFRTIFFSEGIAAFLKRHFR